MRVSGEIIVAVSLDQFVSQLVASSLMSADAVAALIDSLPADKKPQDGEKLARELVRQKKLTAYQAQQIYAGKGKSLVLGNYVILDKLGQGGMGLVLKAEHRRMERLVALKVLSPTVTKTPEALRRFQREVKAAARLTHPNIVTAYDADEAGGTHFLVTEYVDGTDLAAIVKEKGPLPLGQALDCILQAARGLQYAHEHGVVHRDIKPANLLLDRQGTVKILDMGLARLESAGAEQDQLTGTGQIMGTVDYMAPEQAMNTRHADQRADIYSLGVTLWYLLTGRPLFEGETTVEKLMGHQTKPVPSLRGACPDVSPQLDAAFAKMVAKLPTARYQTMAEAIADLEQCRSGTAAAPAVQAVVAEDARLEEFLREIGGPSRQHTASPRRPAPTAAPALATKALRTIAPAADPGATLDMAGPQVGTDPQTEQSLPAGRPLTLAAKPARRPPRPPWWQDWRILAAAGAGGLLLILLGVWIIVRDKEGREVARVAVPEGGSATVETTTEPGGAKPTPHRNLPTGPEPPLAIAPFDAAQAKKHQQAWAEVPGPAGGRRDRSAGRREGGHGADPAGRVPDGFDRRGAGTVPGRGPGSQGPMGDRPDTERRSAAPGADHSAVLSGQVRGDAGPVGVGDGEQSVPVQGQPIAAGGEGELGGHSAVSGESERVSEEPCDGVRVAQRGAVGIRVPRGDDDVLAQW